MAFREGEDELGRHEDRGPPQGEAEGTQARQDPIKEVRRSLRSLRVSTLGAAALTNVPRREWWHTQARAHRGEDEGDAQDDRRIQGKFARTNT